MPIKIEFHSKHDSFKNLIADRIRFTFSIDDETSTITLSFYNPIKLFHINNILNEDESLIAKFDLNINLRLTSKDIRFIWVKGKPNTLQVIFLITSKSQSKILKDYIESII